VAQVVQSGRTQAGTGLIISSSRAVLYASAGAEFAGAARAAAEKLRTAINRARRAR
jgi:orotidine-5'-phosphate decarboxylase